MASFPRKGYCLLARVESHNATLEIPGVFKEKVNMHPFIRIIYSLAARHSMMLLLRYKKSRMMAFLDESCKQAVRVSDL
jgi:hypothetical protein